MSPSASTIWFRFNGYNLSTHTDAPQTGEDGTLFGYAVNRTQSNLVLVGNAELSESERQWLHRYAGPVVCADGGARWPRPAQIERIIGDGDSVPLQLQSKLEQDTDENLNDLQKVLRRIHSDNPAHCMIGLGFLGQRWDHSLTNLNELPKQPNLRLVHEQQILSGHVNDCYIAYCPKDSDCGIHPITPCQFEFSEGLVYPLNQLNLAPLGRMGSSNKAMGGPIRIKGQGTYLMIRPWVS